MLFALLLTGGFACVAQAQDRAVTVGAVVTDHFRESTPQLPSGSHYLIYRYDGRPGDRLAVTMQSAELDAFLSWGRIVGGAFRVEVSDDDSGGGTDARMEVLVGDEGPYAIRATSYWPEERGPFELRIERLPELATGGSDGTGRGRWMLEYRPEAGRGSAAAVRMIQEDRVLEAAVERLNRDNPIPRDVRIMVDGCGAAGAFFDPSRDLIVLCHELLGLLSEQLAPDGLGERKGRDAVSGALSFVLMHEVGHALVELLDLPITGREEDAVDQLATLLMLETGEKGSRAALAAMLAIQPEEAGSPSTPNFAGVHSLSAQRLYNVICWIYATDPPRYGPLVAPLLPVDRMAVCPSEYDRFARAWSRILQMASTARP